jgi:hypothetical protein
VIELGKPLGSGGRATPAAANPTAVAGAGRAGDRITAAPRLNGANPCAVSLGDSRSLPPRKP